MFVEVASGVNVFVEDVDMVMVRNLVGDIEGDGTVAVCVLENVIIGESVAEAETVGNCVFVFVTTSEIVGVVGTVTVCVPVSPVTVREGVCVEEAVT